MCGLVGVAGNCTLNIKDTFTQLLLVDVVRGHHATGAASVSRADDKITLAKAPIPSPYFIGTKQYEDFIGTVGLKTMIGHNRHATVGEKTVENSHPFKFDGIVGAHNGTLDNWALKSLMDWDLFGTDSEAIYHSIAHIGLKETIAKLTGAWALTWFDASTNSINLLRNSKRPLFYAYSKDRESLFWASEADMLEWVLKRNDIKLFEDGIFPCEADNHYRWTIPPKANDQFEKPHVSKVEGRSFTTGVKVYGGKGKWNDSTSTGYFGQHSGTQTFGNAKTLVYPPKKVDTTKFRPPYKDAYGHVINKVQFEKLTQNSCVFCDSNHTKWGDFILPLKDDMDGRKIYLCEDCYNDDDIRELIEQAL